MARPLNLAAIETALRRVQAQFPLINRQLETPHDRMDDEVVENMLSGYALVNDLSLGGVELFALGNLKYFLELNTRVLCRTSEAKRREYAKHIAATERRFYEQTDGGIQDIMEWYAMHKGESVWQRAAGVYVRMLSAPQLFIEGNHRSGALVMSYLLAREGKPPFVLTVENALAYFNPSAVITKTRKKSLAMLFRLPKIKSRFAAFLKEQADDSYLL
ncbi:conserved protein of unknown function [Candidatus Methylocalor cossyra]|uniref:Fido domain-containing protein n=2 Tax=Candidatus Methylocalor cossyra TaxID=3108543 RepID=A0ABM9NE06_9GAMM